LFDFPPSKIVLKAESLVEIFGETFGKDEHSQMDHVDNEEKQIWQQRLHNEIEMPFPRLLLNAN
jgi:hypothetical protein